MAALEPAELLRKAEESGNFTARLALMEEFKALPFAAIWNEFCDRAGVPVGTDYVKAVEDYEKSVLANRK